MGYPAVYDDSQMSACQPVSVLLKVSSCRLAGKDPELENLYIRKGAAYKDVSEAAREVMREPVSYTHLDVYKRQYPSRVSL